LYAAKLVPVDVMDHEQLTTVPANTTQSPFEEKSAAKGAPKQRGMPKERGKGRRHQPVKRQPVGDTSKRFLSHDI
jgi:hypothetical protein